MTTPGSDAGPFGVLLVDKPEGPTSHDVVDRARRALDERSVGHTGTLDPFASGLLILCVGRATRLTEYFHALDKEYLAGVRLGVETATHDPEGEVVAESEAWRGLDRERLEEALAALSGRIRQRPPAFSAKRVGGERAHRAAREGRGVELEPVSVTVHELEVTAFQPPEVELRCRVGTGTYVRAIARDLGRDLGCGAHLRTLRRTRVGPFAAAGAVDGAALEETRGGGLTPDTLGEAWLEPASALSWLPRRELEADEARAVAHGNPVPRGRVRAPRSPATEETAGAPVMLLHEGRLLAVAEQEGDRLQPRKVFARAA